MHKERDELIVKKDQLTQLLEDKNVLEINFKKLRYWRTKQTERLRKKEREKEIKKKEGKKDI